MPFSFPFWPPSVLGIAARAILEHAILGVPLGFREVLHIRHRALARVQAQELPPRLVRRAADAHVLEARLRRHRPRHVGLGPGRLRDWATRSRYEDRARATGHDLGGSEQC